MIRDSLYLEMTARAVTMMPPRRQELKSPAVEVRVRKEAKPEMDSAEVCTENEGNGDLRIQIQDTNTKGTRID
jgi:hypothetical protein